MSSAPHRSGSTARWAGTKASLITMSLLPVPPHPRGEPRVEYLIVRAREQEPAQSVGTRAGDRHHDPGGRVAAAGEAPATGHSEPAARRLDLAARGIQAAREERIRPRREELFLGLLGKVAEPPVVRRPQ